MSAIRHVKSALAQGTDPGESLNDLTDMLNPSEPNVAFTRTLVKLHLAPYLQELGM